MTIPSFTSIVLFFLGYFTSIVVLVSIVSPMNIRIMTILFFKYFSVVLAIYWMKELTFSVFHLLTF